MYDTIRMIHLHEHLLTGTRLYYDQMLLRSSLLLNGIEYNHEGILENYATDLLYLNNPDYDTNNNQLLNLLQFPYGMMNMIMIHEHLLN